MGVEGAIKASELLERSMDQPRSYILLFLVKLDHLIQHTTCMVGAK